jgi:phenylpropionate dioxygenase-like ring-hydroxylating dioxygenase large terminal subunit
MDRVEQNRLLRRARRVLQGGTPEMREGMRESPVQRYIDTVLFEKEQALFRRTPRPVCASSDVAEPGAWLARECLGRPVLITRDGDGTLHAFLNVCRHRGMQLIQNGTGKDQLRFSCPYHAWQYAANGDLLLIRKNVGFPEAKKGGLGLRRLAVSERFGIVWLVVDPEFDDLNISEYLGPLANELEMMGFGRHVGYGRREFQIRSNWKLIVDGSLEDYHFKILHKETSAPLFVDTAQVVELFGSHLRIFLPKTTLLDVSDEDVEELQVRNFGNILYFFFPGVWLLVQPDHAMLSFVSPHQVNETMMEEVALIPEAPHSDDLGMRRYWDNNVELFRNTLDEDYALVERIQRGLASGANANFIFGSFEHALDWFHTQLGEHVTRGTHTGVPVVPLSIVEMEPVPEEACKSHDSAACVTASSYEANVRFQPGIGE